MLVRFLQRNRTNRIYREREREKKIYFKALAHVTIKARMSKICRVHSGLEPQGKVRAAVESTATGMENVFLLEGGQAVVSAGLHLIG